MSRKFILGTVGILVLVPIILVVHVINPVIAIRLNNYDFKASPENLNRHVTELSAKPYRNVSNVQGTEKTLNYIKAEWSRLGLSVTEQEFDVYKNKHKNLITRIGDSSKPLLVIGAHYDVYSDYPGADDNASGVAGILELARLLTENSHLVNHPIELVAYANEEQPFYGTEFMGSLIHAKSLSEKKSSVDLMISLEMIGYFTDEPKSQIFPVQMMKGFYPTTGDFIGLVSNSLNWWTTRKVKSLFTKAADIPTYSINSPAFVAGIDYSDHRSYWSQGIPALMITDTAFYRNRNYHTANDRSETLNYNKMAEVINGVTSVVLGW